MPDTTTPFGRFFERVKAFGLEYYRLFYGRYRAKVVDNDDEEGLGRIKVQIPAIGHQEGDWILAYPKFPTPCGKVGDDGYYGMYVPPPDVDEMVWVEFEVGRTKHAIYTGGWFGKGEIPAKVADVAPAVWSLWSRAQHYLTFIDKEGEEEVELAWKAKHKITMDKDKVLITTEGGVSVELKVDGTFAIKDEKNNEVVSSTSGMEVKAGTAKVVLEDGKAEIHASQFTWAPGGSTAAAAPIARGEDLVRVCNALVNVLQNFRVSGAAGAMVTDPSMNAQLAPLIQSFKKTLVPTFKV